MVLRLKQTEDLCDFFGENRTVFLKRLLEEGETVKDQIDEIQRVGNIDLLANAQRLVLYVVEGQREKLITFAKEEGVAWAEHDLTVSLKLDWLQAIHRVLWEFIYQFDCLQEEEMDRDTFFTLEKEFNYLLDEFFSSFFLSFSNFKEKQLKTKQELIEHLSVPVIPLGDSICIVPLIGDLDSSRFNLIQEKLLTNINELKIKTLVLDLSGVPTIESYTVEGLKRLLDSINMMGCKSIITGLQPSTVQTMVQSGVSFNELAEAKGTLQKALEQYFVK